MKIKIMRNGEEKIMDVFSDDPRLTSLLSGSEAVKIRIGFGNQPENEDFEGFQCGKEAEDGSDEDYLHTTSGVYVSPDILEEACIDPEAILEINAAPGAVVITEVREDADDMYENDGEEDEEEGSMERIVANVLYQMEAYDMLNIDKLFRLIQKENEDL